MHTPLTERLTLREKRSIVLLSNIQPYLHAPHAFMHYRGKHASGYFPPDQMLRAALECGAVDWQDPDVLSVLVWTVLRQCGLDEADLLDSLSFSKSHLYQIANDNAKLSDQCAELLVKEILEHLRLTH